MGGVEGKGAKQRKLSSTNWLIKTQPPCCWGNCSDVCGSLAGRLRVCVRWRAARPAPPGLDEFLAHLNRTEEVQGEGL